MSDQQQPLKYKDLISQSENQVKSEQLDLDVQKAKSKLEVTIAQTRFELAEAKQKLSDSQRAIPYCVEEEMRASQYVDDLEGGLAYAEKVLADRF